MSWVPLAQLPQRVATTPTAQPWAREQLPQLSSVLPAPENSRLAARPRHGGREPLGISSSGSGRQRDMWT
jgi:hypothetical protein